MSSVVDLAGLVDVVVGVDTHVLTHSAAVVDAGTGAVLGQVTVPADAEGYAELVEFADQFADQHSRRRVWAVEGTGAHGYGLTRHLEGHEELVVELDRPGRAHRRNGAKSDPLDAIRAAREALSRPRLGTPRRGGERQALAVLLAARRSAVQASTDAQRQVFALVIAAPEPIRKKFRGHRLPAMIKIAANLHTPARSDAGCDIETTVTVTILRTLARRAQTLAREAATQERAIRAIVRDWRPDLLDQPGVGPIVAATVLCAWSHPGRIHSEAAFAMLAGAGPIPATSGQTTTRHRLNPYGDRHLNQALTTVVTSRASFHQPTRDYLARRTSEGKTRREAKRCLKRYIARDLYRLLENHPQPA
jgi:transposase